MTTGFRAAHRRADRGVLGAAFVALFTSTLGVGVEKYVEMRPAPRAAAAAFAQSPAELAAANLKREQECLADAMYYEGRGEGVEGQKAIAEVIFARTRSQLYPHTICGVVHEGSERKKGCQFTYTCDGSMDRAKEAVAWERSQLLAARILAGVERLSGQTGNAIAYHTVDVSPVWAGNMLKTAEIGRHVFYRFAPKRSVVAENIPVGGAMMPSGEIIPVGGLPLVEVQATIEVAGSPTGGT